MVTEQGAATFTDYLPGQVARDLIAAQHRELRRLLATAVGHAFAFENGQRIAHQPLRALLGPLREAFEDRARQDALSFYCLEDELPLGPRLTEHLRQEHARQRQKMEELCAWAREADPLDLPAKLDRLARELLSELAREDRALRMSRRPRPTA